MGSSPERSALRGQASVEAVVWHFHLGRPSQATPGEQMGLAPGHERQQHGPAELLVLPGPSQPRALQQQMLLRLGRLRPER